MAAGLIAAAAAAARRGAFAETGRLLEEALRLGDRSARVYYNLGVAYGRLGDGARAAACHRLALVDEPTHAGALANLGQALRAAGAGAGAQAVLRRVAVLTPDDARAHNNLGPLRMDAGDDDGAAHVLRRAAALAPAYGHAWYNLGLLARRRGDGGAEALYRRAAACGDAPVRTWFELGVIAHQRGRADLAADLYARTLAADSGDDDARANRMMALQEDGRPDQAMAEVDRLLARRPDDPRALYVRGWTRLLRGELAAGYPDYDQRWRRPDPELRQHRFPVPLWDGGTLPAGRRLLLWGEFGVGDEIIMAGLLDEVLARGLSVVLETDVRFVGLFARSWPAVTVVPRTDPPDPRTLAPEIAAQSSTMRLPVLLRSDAASFRPHAGYLRPDPERVRRHRAAFAAAGPGRTVGLAWTSGNPRTGGRKSIALERWAPVLAVPGVRFVSLQYTDAAEEIAAARAGGRTNLWPNPNPALRDDPEDLAAQIAALDAVVTIAGINAHMAGALGRPGLVLLPRTPLWFWFDRGEDCPWYPSLRLVRCTVDGDWDTPIARLAQDLRRLVGG
ncbi:tetratricopeptide repeat protein [Azospirillum halopraeferens]|uniref:tetratricopeptide repeat protein n=1 Tax=Azospirillum halopraeferens TaxID=34010 RepID=UPI00042990C5|nr:tetratricopeptide repeat protein [Azospirillum halopraeferens]